jgi:hypothetical protein
MRVQKIRFDIDEVQIGDEVVDECGVRKWEKSRDLLKCATSNGQE